MKKIFKILSVICIVIFVFVGLFVWATLTERNVIPNYLNIEYLNNDNNNYNDDNGINNMVRKPVIYLYPTQEQEVSVKLDFNGKLIADYPDFDSKINGWQVLAFPDGHLINKKDNKEYSYIFWEGISNSEVKYDLSKGFVVEGRETKDFLQKKLSEIGLTPKEYNEFIVYWYPEMQNNNYNLIYFAREEYTENAKLNIFPKPDSVLRVFMVFKPLDNKIIIEPQKFEKFERKGFAVIEWGGAEIK